MSPHHVGAAETATRFPRVSGDEPSSRPVGAAETVFSPRERG